jgi:CDP-diacylglycerol--serine O-phosphatidyltransferase
MKKHIPNTLTCCNLLCGCAAIYFALQPVARYDWALYAIIVGAVFDFFDGFVARLLGVSSPIGKELDSLADDITFGVAPSAIVYSLLRESISDTGDSLHTLLPFAAFLIAAFSALRLAKFNLDERQSTSFIGHPTPANTLFWAALAVGGHAIVDTPWAPWILLAGIVVSCWLLVAEIPMFALKFKHFGWKGNALRYSFLLVSLLLLLVAGWAAFSLIILLYILVSLIACRKQDDAD